MPSSFSVIVTDQVETERLGQLIAQTVCSGAIVFLSGQLGAGKTTLAQSIGKALGVTEVINSPSFLIVKEYPLGEQQTLIHADLYRVESEADVISTGLFDLIGAKHSISIIEWPEKINAFETLPHLHISMHLQETIREIDIIHHGDDELHARIWKGLKNAYASH